MDLLYRKDGRNFRCYITIPIYCVSKERAFKRVLRIFDNLRKYKNRRIIIDSRDPIVVGGQDALEKDFTQIFKDFSPMLLEKLI